MKFFDKVLLFCTSCCISIILMVILTGEISSKYSSSVSYSAVTDKADKGKDTATEMIIYGKEIDETISKYFQSIADKADDEEVRRVLDENEQKNVRSDFKKQPKKKARSDIKKDKIHVVQKGESLWKISHQFQIPVYTLVSANPAIKTKIIHPGDRLLIPSRKGLFYKVKRGDSLARIAAKYKIPLQTLQKDLKIKNKIFVGQKIFLPNAKPLPKTQYRYVSRFIWPLRGRITSRHGWRIHPILRKKHFHRGIDISARPGTSIRSIAKGVVMYAGTSGHYGNLILIRHKGGYISAYAHCSRIFVRKGNVVKQGKIIGRVGNTGRSTGPHLHFEIRRHRKHINPIVGLRIKERKAIRSL